MNTVTIHPGAALLVVLLLLMGSFAMMAGCAQEYNPLTEGQASYQQYCMSCHGPDGKGVGDIAGDLATLPTDLTQLTAHHDGAFPVDKLYRMIDGRAAEAVVAHGTREMPIWGNIWSDVDGAPVQREVVEQRINELVEYIRSMQETS